jgi:hypothetical protein
MYVTHRDLSNSLISGVGKSQQVGFLHSISNLMGVTSNWNNGIFFKCKTVLILKLELIVQMTANKENYCIQNNV